MIDGKLVVAFDVDDTLLIPNIAIDNYLTGEEPIGYIHTQNVNVFNWYKQCGCYMIVWSGTGPEWAEKWAKKFKLEPDEIRIKQKYDDIDISIDDCIVDLAKTNIRVKRVNNHISRKIWNTTKHI